MWNAGGGITWAVLPSLPLTRVGRPQVLHHSYLFIIFDPCSVVSRSQVWYLSKSSCARVSARVALIVGTWEPGSEEVETERGNGRERERERDPPPPPSLFNSSLHFLSLSPYRETLATSPLSLPLFPLFLSPIHPISDASKPDLRHLSRISKKSNIRFQRK